MAPDLPLPYLLFLHPIHRLTAGSSLLKMAASRPITLGAASSVCLAASIAFTRTGPWPERMSLSNFVFIHGPGAGGCADSFINQLRHFPNSVAPTLPGHPDGTACRDVERYTEWLRGWLWSQERREDLVLVGFTLGACIALQYALDYPEEVQALALMTVSMGPKQRAPGTLEFRLRAAEDPGVHQEWLEAMRHTMMFIEPQLQDRLIQRHEEVGPMSQYRDLVTIDQFDVRDRIHTLKPPLLLIRGLDDPGRPPEYELDLHLAVAGSKYLKLEQAGHFPMVERPETVNQAIDDLLSSGS